MALYSESTTTLIGQHPVNSKAKFSHPLGQLKILMLRLGRNSSGLIFSHTRHSNACRFRSCRSSSRKHKLESDFQQPCFTTLACSLSAYSRRQL